MGKEFSLCICPESVSSLPSLGSLKHSCIPQSPCSYCTYAQTDRCCHWLYVINCFSLRGPSNKADKTRISMILTLGRYTVKVTVNSVLSIFDISISNRLPPLLFGAPCKLQIIPSSRKGGSTGHSLSWKYFYGLWYRYASL